MINAILMHILFKHLQPIRIAHIPIDIMQLIYGLPKTNYNKIVHITIKLANSLTHHIYLN